MGTRGVAAFAAAVLTEGSQRKHAVELPLLGVADDVSGVIALLGAVEQRPPEVGLAQQAEHTQLPLDLQEDGRREGLTSSLNINENRNLCTSGY